MGSRHSYAKPGRRACTEAAADAVVLLAIFAFLVSYFNPELMLSTTVTAGGDTASDFYPASYLRDVLLPEGRLSGWAPGWYCGFPMFQFYFLPTFVLMAALGAVMPLQVAFKLVTVLGTFLLPLAAYACMRLMRFRFPAPAIAAVFTLPFLFMEANSMWGGNIPSTLAGEFSYSLGLAMAVLFFGTLHRAMSQPEPRSMRWLLLNAALFAAITLTHVYAMLFAGLASAFFLVAPLLKRDRKGFAKNFVYFFKMYGLAFLLVAFWLVPLLAKMEYTTPYNYRWTVNGLDEVFPSILLPFYALAAVGVYSSVRKRDGRVAFFASAVLAAAVLYLAASALGVVDIRFVPFVQLMPMFAAAAGAYAIVDYASGKFGGRYMQIALLIVIAAATIWWTHGHVTFIDYWIQWNYSGFEAKQLWPQFSAINAFLNGTAADPRVVYEHSQLHDSAGSTRAFESLPLFSGRSTLEGLFMQSSATAPFVFWTQSEISQQGSCPFPQYSCTRFNVTAAARHLELLNVKQVVARTDATKAALEASSLYALEKTFEPYAVYELLPGSGRYVTVPEYEPVVFDASGISGGWKAVAYEWFQRDELLDVPLVFSDVPMNGVPRLRASDLDTLPKVAVAEECNVTENVTNDAISFHTDCIGLPHLVKVSYFPNWQADGADGPYLASPSFMVVVPTQPDVTLHYGATASDYAGMAMTLSGIALVAYAAHASFSRSQKRTSRSRR